MTYTQERLIARLIVRVRPFLDMSSGYAVLPGRPWNLIVAPAATASRLYLSRAGAERDYREVTPTTPATPATPARQTQPPGSLLAHWPKRDPLLFAAVPAAFLATLAYYSTAPALTALRADELGAAPVHYAAREVDHA